MQPPPLLLLLLTRRARIYDSVAPAGAQVLALAAGFIKARGFHVGVFTKLCVERIDRLVGHRLPEYHRHARHLDGPVAQLPERMSNDRSEVPGSVLGDDAQIVAAEQHVAGVFPVILYFVCISVVVFFFKENKWELSGSDARAVATKSRVAGIVLKTTRITCMLREMKREEKMEFHMLHWACFCKDGPMYILQDDKHHWSPSTTDGIVVERD